MQWVSLAVAILALVIAVINLVRGERNIRRAKRAAEEAWLPSEQTVAAEFDLAFDLPKVQPHATTIKVAMDPEEFDPDDLTKGDGEVTFRDYPLDPKAEIRGAAVPHYRDESDLAEEVDHQREARGS